MRIAEVHEIESDTEVQMQLAQITKQVALIIIHVTTNKEQCGLCSTLGHGTSTYPY